MINLEAPKEYRIQDASQVEARSMFAARVARRCSDGPWHAVQGKPFKVIDRHHPRLQNSIRCKSCQCKRLRRSCCSKPVQCGAGRWSWPLSPNGPDTTICIL
jgi:hypothetical protein